MQQLSSARARRRSRRRPQREPPGARRAARRHRGGRRRAEDARALRRRRRRHGRRARASSRLSTRCARGGRLLRVRRRATATPGCRSRPFRIYNDEITVLGSMAVLNSFGPALDADGAGAIDAAGDAHPRLRRSTASASALETRAPRRRRQDHRSCRSAVSRASARGRPCAAGGRRRRRDSSCREPLTLSRGASSRGSPELRARSICRARADHHALYRHFEPSREGRRVPRAARGRAVRDPQPVGRRLGDGARGARLQGAGDDQLGLRVHARAARTAARRSTRSSRTSRRSPRPPACRSSVDLENGYGPSRPTRPTAIARAGRRGRGRRLDRGLRPGDGRLYDLEPRGRARRGGGEAARRCRSRSRSPRAPRTTSAATPTSTTRSRGCRPTRRPAPTSSSRPGCGASTRSRAVCAAVSKPVNVLGHRGLASVRRDRSRPARSAISVGGALTWVAVAALTEAAEALRDGDLSVLAASAPKELLG